MVTKREPLDKENVCVPKGRIFVIPERCKECDFCIKFCPKEALEKSEQINTKGYHYPTMKEGKVGACVDCGFCFLICPEFAIYTLDAKEERGGKGEVLSHE